MAYIPTGVRGDTLPEVVDTINQELLKIEETLNTFQSPGTLNIPIANAPARHQVGRCVIILPNALEAWGEGFTAGVWTSDGSTWHRLVEFTS